MYKRYYTAIICSVLILLSCATQQDLDNQSTKIKGELRGIQDSIGNVNNSLSNINDSFEELSKRNHEMDATLQEAIESLRQEIVDTMNSIKSAGNSNSGNESGIVSSPSTIPLDSMEKIIAVLTLLKNNVETTNNQVNVIYNQLNQTNAFKVINTINEYSRAAKGILSTRTQGVLFVISLISFVLLTKIMGKKEIKNLPNYFYKILHLLASSIMGVSFGILLTKGILSCLAYLHLHNIIR